MSLGAYSLGRFALIQKLNSCFPATAWSVWPVSSRCQSMSLHSPESFTLERRPVVHPFSRQASGHLLLMAAATYVHSVCTLTSQAYWNLARLSRRQYSARRLSVAPSISTAAILSCTLPSASRARMMYIPFPMPFADPRRVLPI